MFKIPTDPMLMFKIPTQTPVLKTNKVGIMNTVFIICTNPNSGPQNQLHYFHANKLAKLRRHASRVHFAKIHFGEIHFGKIHLKKYTLEKINFGGIHFDDCCTEGQPEIGNPKV